MAEKGYEQFIIDPEFKTLIHPLQKEEYAMLEANLVLDGCRDPLVIWHGIIIDGHNRYEICNRLHIPYAYAEMFFEDRIEVVAWICSNQLGRRNISEETRKYLIGRQYEAEKVISQNRNQKGVNQYTKVHDETDEEILSTDLDIKDSARHTATKLSKKYHVSTTAVRNYGRYSQALDKIAKSAPELVPQILSGNYKISYGNIMSMADMSTDELKKIGARPNGTATSFVRYSESRKDFCGDKDRKPTRIEQELPGIKKMPTYDPDAEVAGLTLTIPSWTSSIERTKESADFNVVSNGAKERLEEVLAKLHHEILEILRALKGEQDV